MTLTEARARLQYELSQQPRLLPYLQRDEPSLLKSAVASHRDALKISQDSPDLLLYANKHPRTEDRYGPDASNSDPFDLFHEALDCFQRCADLQAQLIVHPDERVNLLAGETMELDEQALDSTTTVVAELKPSMSEVSDEETWATIVEPVTEYVLADTHLAQVATLTSLCNLLSVRENGDPRWIDVYYFNNECNYIVSTRNRLHEFMLAKTRYKCALADAGFSLARYDVLQYERYLTEAQAQLKERYSNDPQALCDMADAELIFNASVERLSHRVFGTVSDERDKLNIIRWRHLTRALDHLTIASKLPTARNLPRIHLRRGDCELLRRRLGANPWNYDLAVRSALTLLKNAEIYYRGAARLAKADFAVDEEDEASTKEALVAALVGNSSKLHARTNNEVERMPEVMQDTMDDGLLSEEDVERLSA
ncbi:MAG: hypothetical protein Q9218_002655 [Villophora microphyllina]